MVRVLLEPPPRRHAQRARSAEIFRWGFLLIGLIACGFSGYIYLDSHVYQSYQDWSFDQEANGKTPTVGAFLRDGVAQHGSSSDTRKSAERAATPKDQGLPASEGWIARIGIPRLNVRAIVREGVEESTLRRAVGHVPGTARPGDEGNVGLAGHRDSFFRPLHDVRRDDRIVVETLDATYEYLVDSLKIVGPDDVSVLAPTKEPSLTLVTCYPFHYVGNAPRRFIVRARQVSVEARSSMGGSSRSGL